MHKQFFRPYRNSGIDYNEVFPNSCPVFLALVVYVGLPLGQVLSAGAPSQKLPSTVVSVKLSVERQGMQWQKLGLYVPHICIFKAYVFPEFSSIVVVMHIALICRVFYSLLRGDILKIEGDF